MQVNFKNIQRPTLFQEFFNKLITYSNEVIEYINTSTTTNVTSNIRTSAISLTNIIKKTIKDSYTYIKNLFISAFT